MMKKLSDVAHWLQQRTTNAQPGGSNLAHVGVLGGFVSPRG